MNTLRRLTLLAAALASSLPVTASEGDALALEEVIVTAQKRAESFQEVPSAIVAFGTEDIENAGWGDINQIQHAMPSLSEGGEDPARPYLFIRGIGTKKFDISGPSI